MPVSELHRQVASIALRAPDPARLAVLRIALTHEDRPGH
jgi:hypothetical protein